MKILDFDLEGSHFIIEADISPRQEADDDMECQWLRYDFDNTQVYKETDGAKVAENCTPATEDSLQTSEFQISKSSSSSKSQVLSTSEP